MSGSDLGTLVLAAGANLAGIAVAGLMWRRRRRRRRALRSRHPSVRPPLRVDLVHAGAARRIRLGVPTGAPTVTIDIVSFRRHDESRPWESEPLDAPLEIAPGASAVLATALGPDTSSVDVVVAWTAHGDAGPVTGSQLFRLPPERGDPVTARANSGLAGRAAAALVVLLLGSGALVALSALDDDVGGATDEPTPTTEVAPDIGTGPSPTPAPSAPPTAAPAPTAAPGTTETGTTTIATTTVATTTVATTPVSTSIAPDGGPTVDAVGRIEPCRFGDDCLVVGFTISGFAESPTEYVCEFDDGSRFEFGFVGDGTDTACATGSPTAAVVVEVGGVRSETITRP